MATMNSNNASDTRKKVKTLRHIEYYDMQDTFDKLYADSLRGQVFENIYDMIFSGQNILLAYRNMKSNAGSRTPGTDNLTIQDIAKLSPDEMVGKVNSIIKNYAPRATRRKDIPKPNGKTRPLGIPCIWDRLIQQCMLQVLEPICEARFSDNSHGFRPNRSAEHAIASAERIVNLSKLQFVIEVDISSFFDEVNHSKLIRQLWAMGIRDKKVIYIIRRMLDAPIKMPNGTIVKPTKGTPQGGILSPLLANVVLNELDRWVESQWQKNPITAKYSIGTAKNGAPNYGVGYHAMRGTRLKEMYIVRYADDFRIFCRYRETANKTLVAVTQWLQERLRLQVSAEKTRIINLKKQYSEFLGIKMKLTQKGQKQVVKSHVTDKALRRITSKAKELINDIAYPSDSKAETTAIRTYNAFVMGEQNYYCMATAVSKDFANIAFTVARVLKTRLGDRLKNTTPFGFKDVVQVRYGKSKMMRYVSGQPIAPIGYVRTKAPQSKKRTINKYTPEGRQAIHKRLGINTWLMLDLMRQYIPGRSIEYMDNRISLFCAQYGKCAITHREFMSRQEIHCHHKIPVGHGGKDNYQNLLLVLVDVHKLIHATEEATIQKYLTTLKLTSKEVDSLNKYRKIAGNEPVTP